MRVSGHRSHALLARDTQQRPPVAFLVPAAVTRRQRAVTGIEEREVGNAIRRLPENLERDAAAHRVAGDSEMFRSLCDDAARHRGKRVERAVIRYQTVEVRAQRRELILPHRLVAKETREEHDGSSGHGSFISMKLWMQRHSRARL